MSVFARFNPDGIPGPQDFEVVLSRKISNRSSNLLQTVKGLDMDDDGYISKKDLQITLRDFFGVHLSKSQIDTIFASARRFQRSRDDSYSENRNDQNVSNKDENAIDSDVITFTMFMKYINHTSYDSLHPSSRMMESNMHIKATAETTKDGQGKDEKSEAALIKALRAKVLGAIRQSVPKGNFGMVSASIYLQMDANKDNEVTHAEFQSWLETKHGIHLTDYEMKLVYGKWEKEEGLTLQEFTYFIECLLAEYRVACICNSSCHDMNANLTSKQRPDKNILTLLSHDEKTDKELIWILLNYFREINKSYAQAFNILDDYGNKNLTPTELSKGFKTAGFNVSAERSRILLRKFAHPNGKVDLPGFVRLMTSEPLPDHVD